MGNPRNHAEREISSKFSIFLPLRAIFKKPYHFETPCRLILLIKELILLNLITIFLDNLINHSENISLSNGLLRPFKIIIFCTAILVESSRMLIRRKYFV
jgi:hypothetical protein